MKKSSYSQTTKLSGKTFRALLSTGGAALFLTCIVLGSVAHATDVDPNKLLAFKKIYIEPIQDNVDGVFKAPVEQSYKQVFDHNPRFELTTDKSSADADIRTIIDKKTSGLDIEIDLILGQTGEVFSADKTTVPSNASGQDTGVAVKQLLKAALKRVPFYGTVTGRDGKELTFDIGSAQGVKEGDIIQISRIDNIKRHPLLKTIVDVQIVPVGSAAIDQVEDTIAFGHVYKEITGEQIQKYHKVTAIEGHIQEPAVDEPQKPQESNLVVEKDSDDDSDRPHLGYVGLGVGLGGFSSSTSIGNGARTLSGSAFNLGMKLNGELWFTKNWFGDLTLGASTMSYGQADTTTNINPPGVAAKTYTFGIDGGYKFLPTGSIRGPQIAVKLGYYSFSWSVPVDSATLLTGKTYSGLNLGLGGVLPIMSPNTGALLNLNLLLFPSLNEDEPKTGPDSSPSGVTFYFGGYYFLNPKLSLRGGIDVEIFSSDFGPDNSRASTSQKAISFIPSVQYYF